MYVSLYEPSKHEVAAFDGGRFRPDRLAEVVIRERAEHATYEGIVRLRDGGVTATSGCTASSRLMFEEFMAAEDIVRNDPRWQEAMSKRGITNFDLCMIDPCPRRTSSQASAPTTAASSRRSPGCATTRKTTATPTRSTAS